MLKKNFNFGWKLSVGSRRNRKAPIVVDLPNDYISTLPRNENNPGAGSVGFFASSEAEYENTIEIPEGFDGTVLLQMDGVYEKAEVFINRDLMYQHPYGYTGVVCDLTDWLVPGKNSIRVCTSAYQPASRWYTGGGMYRVASLHQAGKVYIHPWGAFVTTPVAEKDRAVVNIALEVTSRLDAADASVKAEILSACGCAVAETAADTKLEKGENKLNLSLELADPALWDVDAPNLYTARITVSGDFETDVHEMTFGVRKIEIDAKNGFRLNGRKMKLNGGCVHHDSGFLGSAAFPASEDRKIRLLKEAGFNAIRTAHNPPSAALLDACDRHGMLVLEESFDCWRYGKNSMDYHVYFEKWWDYDTACMVKRDRNHPSVYCWSIGNEIMEFDGASNGVYWGKVQADLVRELDPTRPVSSGINVACGRPQNFFDNMDYTERAYQMAHATGVYDGVDRWANATKGNIENLDVSGYNYLFSRYGDDKVNYPDRVIQGTETMPFYTWENWQAVRDNDNVIGDFVWVAYDNLGEAGMGKVTWSKGAPTGGIFGAAWPWMSCFQGDLDLTGYRLPISYYRNVVWGKDKDAHLFTRHPSLTGYDFYGNGWHWDEVSRNWTWGDEWLGKPVVAAVYADADEVEFVLNGASVTRAVPEKMIAYAEIPYEKGKLVAIAYKNGAEVSRDRLVTAGPAAKIALVAERPIIDADGMDLCYVNAQLVDGNGVPVVADGVEISVSVSGKGTLAGLGSGQPKTEENFGTGRRLTFQGRVTAAVRAAKEAGNIEIAFTAPGLPAALLNITAR